MNVELSMNFCFITRGFCWTYPWEVMVGKPSVTAAGPTALAFVKLALLSWAPNKLGAYSKCSRQKLPRIPIVPDNAK